ncbi:MAG: antibiotic biosynthesis monooxygenase [Bacteroidales bacterium]|nr:antibiotic biosynthesis monooxygenase [Bacteroidales bacterium]
MIRLNAFFVLKEGVSLDELKAVTDELVAKSRQDEGNKGYDLFQSTTNPSIMMFCESWENQAVLDKHSAAPHFTYAVPKIGEMAVDGLKIESFED